MSSSALCSYNHPQTPFAYECYVYEWLIYHLIHHYDMDSLSYISSKKETFYLLNIQNWRLEVIHKKL